MQNSTITRVILILLLALSSSLLNAEINDEDKILILTDYLVKEEQKDVLQARNEAIATVYGKPIFKKLIYNDNSEMFFATVVSEHGNFQRDVNFYMPRERAVKFKKELDSGKIEIEHAFDDNKIVIKEIELNYEGVNYPLRMSQTQTLIVKAGGYFVGTQNTKILAAKNGIGGTIDLQELFDMQEKVSVFRLDALYKFNPKHAIEFSYYSLKNSSTKELQQPLEFNGKGLAKGTSVDIYFNTDIYKLNYIYSAYKTNKLDLTFRAGLHITKITTGVDAKIDFLVADDEALKSESVALTAPLPVFGMGLGYKLSNDFTLNYTVDYFFISFENVTGSMVDTLLSLDYQYNQYIGAGFGLNTTKTMVEGRVDSTKLEVGHDVNGALAYLIFSY